MQINKFCMWTGNREHIQLTSAKHTKFCEYKDKNTLKNASAFAILVGFDSIFIRIRIHGICSNIEHCDIYLIRLCDWIFFPKIFICNVLQFLVDPEIYREFYLKKYLKAML